MGRLIKVYKPPPLNSTFIDQVFDFKKIFEKKGKSYYFSPIRGALYELTPLEKKKLKKERKVEGIVDVTPWFLKKWIEYKNFSQISSSKLHIFPTTQCNASCIYCYARPNEYNYKLDVEIAKKAVDLVATTNSLEICFHGGGEPLIEKELISEIIEYAKKKCNNVKIILQSNGIMNKATRRWVLKNTDYLIISCDGPPEIQNKQRPLKNGSESSPIVEKTIRFFVKHNMAFHVMCTITAYSVLRMDEIVNYFRKLGVKIIGMNPVIKKKEYGVDLDLFAKYFLKARIWADSHGLLLLSPQMFPSTQGKPQGCGFSNIMFCLTPDGFVSNCYETVSSKVGHREFIYGRFNGSAFKFDQKKIAWMKKRRVENLSYCRNCLLRWTCAGGCAAHSLRLTGDIFKQPKKKCEVKQRLFYNYLIHLIKNHF